MFSPKPKHSYRWRDALLLYCFVKKERDTIHISPFIHYNMERASLKCWNIFHQMVLLVGNAKHMTKPSKYLSIHSIEILFNLLLENPLCSAKQTKQRNKDINVCH